ncbi:hypothetical protein SDC9_126850 [bioreactor metagenome]|uniref:Uncharacterized protein n=1 Tax=bioreactor metagenome TaxID=1076179 RepID=A0A645CSH1_9ZZZZ
MKALRKGADLEKINDIHNAAAAYQRQPAGIRRMTFLLSIIEGVYSNEKICY